MIQIPAKTDKQWTQPNTGEILGNVFATRNINFDVMGYAKLARRSTPLIFNLTNFNAVTSLSTLDGITYYTTTAAGLWSFKLDGTTPINMNTFGATSTIRDDGVTWYGRWYVSTDGTTGEIWNFDGAWHDSGISLTHNNWHPLCVHEELNYLIVGDGSTITSYTSASTTSHSQVTSITIPTNYAVRRILYNGTTVYILTKNLKGGDAMVYTWDGVSTTFQSARPVLGASWAFSGCIYKGVLVIISSKGQLLRDNGSGWDELEHLPVYDTPYSWYDGNGFVDGKVEARGMVVKGERIYINLDGYINSLASNGQLPNQPSGVWVYDEGVGLYHKASPTIDILSADMSITSANTVNSVLTTSGTVTAPAGTKVFIRVSDIGGLVSGQYYFLIPLSSTRFQLATTYANAIVATFIPLTSAGSGASKISMHNDVTYGQTSNNIYQPGAIALISDLQTSVSSFREYTASQILYGAGNVLDNTNTPQFSLQSLTQGENRGSIITTKIFSNDIQDTWQYINSKYNYLFQGNDKIFPKFRTADVMNYPLSVQAVCTWVNPTTFTTAADLSSVQNGDELEICSGRGSGCCAHVMSTTFASGTWTVILDDSVPGVVAGDIFNDAFFDNWTKLITVTSSSPPFSKNPVSRVAKWIQAKFILRGVSEPYLEELQVINAKFTPSN